MSAPDELKTNLQEKLFLGRTLLSKLADRSALKKVQGIPKLEKKIRQELKFLEKFEDPAFFSGLKKEHISCSNLIHLGCIVDELLLTTNPSAVMHPFSLKQEFKTKKVTVDIVSDKGHSWIKVVARNPRSLDQNSMGGNQFGQRCILDQVKELVKCSLQNEVLFEPPKVKIIFASGVTKGLHRRICKIGADVGGEIVSVSEDEEDDDGYSDDYDSDEDDESLESDEDEDVIVSEEDQDHGVDDTKVNLDITAMIAYVSAMTNGRSLFQFREKILNEQAAWERERPVKACLERMFGARQLVCCASAMADFRTILGTLGGPGERERGEELIARIQVVPDQTSLKTERLATSGKIKSRSLAIFATGDALRVVTITANTGFIRAAAGQGVTFATVTHESRALTEDKEKTAAPLEMEKTAVNLEMEAVEC